MPSNARMTRHTCLTPALTHICARCQTQYVGGWFLTSGSDGVMVADDPFYCDACGEVLVALEALRQ